MNAPANGIDPTDVNYDVAYMNSRGYDRMERALYTLKRISYTTGGYQALAARLIYEHLAEIKDARNKAEKYAYVYRTGQLWARRAAKLEQIIVSEYFDMYWGLLGIKNPQLVVDILLGLNRGGTR